LIAEQGPAIGEHAHVEHHRSPAGSTITATDGRFARVKDTYFYDKSWTIRYLVVDTEIWLSGRDVLSRRTRSSSRWAACATSMWR
jgi:hypothetical protein